MSKQMILFAALAAGLGGCFQAVGVGGGATSGSGTTGGTTGVGCTCEDGYRCAPDPRTGPDCVPLQCGALDEAACRARSDCTVVVKPTDGFDHCQATQCPALMCPAEVPGCDPVLDADGCPTCGCRQTGCTEDSDCPSGDSCALPICDGPDGPCPAYGTCEPRPSSCTSDADCSSGERCLPDPSGTCNCPSGSPGCTCAQTLTCQPAGCDSDADCAAGERCENSALTGPGECVPAGCTTDADCGSGQYCDIADCDIWGPCPAEGVCAELPDAGSGGCTADSDCGPGSHCEQVTCFRDPCPAICVQDENDGGPAGCTTDADCPSDDYCDPCPSCPPNADCLCAPDTGVCKPYAADGGCITDADCGANQRCDRPACGQMDCCDQLPPGTLPACVPDTTPGQCVSTAFLCGSALCGPDQACVFYGGANNVPACVDAPSACESDHSCACLARELCGANDNVAVADCSGALPIVSCGYP